MGEPVRLPCRGGTILHQTVREKSLRAVENMVRTGRLICQRLDDREHLCTLDVLSRAWMMDLGFMRQCMALYDASIGLVHGRRTGGKSPGGSTILTLEGELGRLDLYQAQIVAQIRGVDGEMFPQYVCGQAEAPAGDWTGPVHVVDAGGAA